MDGDRQTRAVTVFAGSADKLSPLYLDGAWRLGMVLAAHGRTLVFGGGKTGLMGALADGALSAGGQVIGVINAGLNLPNLTHSSLTRLEVVDDIHRRQERMMELGDAFIALPGGFGTLAEVFEALTWAQIGLHHKPVGFLNLNGYFDPLMIFLDRAIESNFIYPEHRQLYQVSTDPDELLTSMDSYQQPEGLSRWLERPLQ